MMKSVFQKNHLKGEEPLIRIAVSDIRSVTKLVNKMGYGLQVLFIKVSFLNCFLLFSSTKMKEISGTE